MGLLSKGFGLIVSTARNIYNASGSTTANRTISIGTHDFTVQDSTNNIEFGIGEPNPGGGALNRMEYSMHTDGAYVFLFANKYETAARDIGGCVAINGNDGTSGYGGGVKLVGNGKVYGTIGYIGAGGTPDYAATVGDDGFKVLVAGIHVFCIPPGGVQEFADNATAYAALGANVTYKTTTGGESFLKITHA